MTGPSDQTMAAMRRLAAQVRDELELAGLPVAAGGHRLVARGAQVEIDALDDDDPGVVVSWRPHPSLAVAADRAVAARDEAAGTMQRFGEIEQAMSPALAAVLTSAGFVLDAEDDLLRVTAAPPGGGTVGLLERTT
ncbi:hypothetical protein [Streptomyces sp. NPDC088910]|uniref:hypothetical protein n=1 Tax=Streptomyces sp. NPDC088910 TaxID=3365911 RepID=UPI00381D4008